MLRQDEEEIVSSEDHMWRQCQFESEPFPVSLTKTKQTESNKQHLSGFKAGECIHHGEVLSLNKMIVHKQTVHITRYLVNWDSKRWDGKDKFWICFNILFIIRWYSNAEIRTMRYAYNI